MYSWGSESFAKENSKDLFAKFPHMLAEHLVDISWALHRPERAGKPVQGTIHCSANTNWKNNFQIPSGRPFSVHLLILNKPNLSEKKRRICFLRSASIRRLTT